MSGENLIAILGGLLGTERQRISQKGRFWGTNISAPKGETWTTGNNPLTLEKFLQSHPLPPNEEAMPLWAEGYTSTYGIPMPSDVKKYMEALKTRARTGMEITAQELDLLKIDSIDPDMF